MVEAFTQETQELLDAADRAIARSRDLAQQRQQIVSECEKSRVRQDVRLAFLREMRKLK